MVMGMYDDVTQFLLKNKNPARGTKKKAYRQTEEKCLGISGGIIRTYINKITREGGPLTIKEPGALWNIYIVDALRGGYLCRSPAGNFGMKSG